VLRSTGSAFEKFVRSEYTTLVEVVDRIFCNMCGFEYTYRGIAVRLARDERQLDFGSRTFDRGSWG